MSFDNFALQSGGKHIDFDVPAQMNMTSSCDNEVDYNRLKESINIQVFKIKSNVQGINRLADKIGTTQDNLGLQESLVNLTNSTRNMIEKSRADIQGLVAMNLERAGQTMNNEIERRMTQELLLAISSFQKAQKLCAERQKRIVAHQQIKMSQLFGQGGLLTTSVPSSWVSVYIRIAVIEIPKFFSSNVAENTRDQMQDQPHGDDAACSTSEAIAFQQSIILDRERDIRDIEAGIEELNAVFHDLHKIIGEQGEMIDNIENNVVSVSGDTRSAGEELTTAHEFQRKAGRRMLCLLLILMLVVTIVLVAILL